MQVSTASTVRQLTVCQMRAVASRRGYAVRRQSSGRWIAISFANQNAVVRSPDEESAWRAAFAAAAAAHTLYVDDAGEVCKKLHDARYADSNVIVVENLSSREAGISVRPATDFGLCSRLTPERVAAG